MQNSISFCNIIRFYSSQDNKNDTEDNKLHVIFNIPNMITMSRIIFSPLITIALMLNYKELALYGCITASVSDFLDGYIARNFDMKTTLGAYLDPLADKIFVGCLTAGLCYQGLIPIPLTILILGRDFLLLSGTMYIRLKDRPSFNTFFDLTKSSFDISPSFLSRANTFMQFSLIMSTLSCHVFEYPTIVMLEPLWYVTGLTTLGSGMGYLIGYGGFKRFTRIGKNKNNNPT